MLDRRRLDLVFVVVISQSYLDIKYYSEAVDIKYRCIYLDVYLREGV